MNNYVGLCQSHSCLDNNKPLQTDVNYYRVARNYKLIIQRYKYFRKLFECQCLRYLQN